MNGIIWSTTTTNKVYKTITWNTLSSTTTTEKKINWNQKIGLLWQVYYISLLYFSKIFTISENNCKRMQLETLLHSKNLCQTQIWNARYQLQNCVIYVRNWTFWVSMNIPCFWIDSYIWQTRETFKVISLGQWDGK